MPVHIVRYLRQTNQTIAAIEDASSILKTLFFFFLDVPYPYDDERLLRPLLPYPPYSDDPEEP